MSAERTIELSPQSSGLVIVDMQAEAVKGMAPELNR
jgi:hypothetical protein